MKLFDGGFAIFVTILLIGAVGWGAFKITNKADGMVEEISESVVELIIEGSLGLPDGSLEDTIDFSPDSREKK